MRDCGIETMPPRPPAGADGWATSVGSMVAGETIDERRDGEPAEPTVPVPTDRVDTLPPTAPTATPTATTPTEVPAVTPLGSGYLLDRVIGSGATGKVWRGRRRRDGTPVAVKVLREELAREPDAVVRFLRQRTVLRALDHPHLVRVHDLVAEGELLAVVMDLVDGEDLRRMAGRQALRSSQALTLLGQVAAALAAVHAAGVVHRDVKPENVLVQWRGGTPYALLTDFGLAGAASGPTDLTRLSQLMGTPAYLAPELVTGRPAEPASDVYALGVMAYELLSGQRPFAAPNTFALLHAHIETEPPRPPGLADPAWELLRAMLAKDPAARPAAGAAAAGFAGLRAAEGLPPPVPPPPPPPAAPPAPPLPVQSVPPAEVSLTGAGRQVALPTTGATRPAPPAPAPDPPRRRRGRLVAALVAVGLVGIGAGVWWGVDRDPPAESPPPAQAPKQYYHLGVTATSPEPGQLMLEWEDLRTTVPGFELYTVYRDLELYDDGADLDQPYRIVVPDHETAYCWRVVAVVASADPPPAPFAAPREICRQADGRPDTP